MRYEDAFTDYLRAYNARLAELANPLMEEGVIAQEEAGLTGLIPLARVGSFDDAIETIEVQIPSNIAVYESIMAENAPLIVEFFIEKGNELEGVFTPERQLVTVDEGEVVVTEMEEDDGEEEGGGE